MKTTSTYRGLQHVLRWLGATATVALAVIVLSLARVHEAAAGLVFLTIVVWFAARAGFRFSLYVASICAISFDYYFLVPLHTFRLAGAQQWIEMLSFLLSVVIVGRLADHARSQTLQAQQRHEDVKRLYALSQEMMLQEDASRLVHDLPQLIEKSFALDSVALYVRDQNQFYASAPSVPPALEARLHSQTDGLSDVQDGPEGYSTLALMLGLKPIGALAWRPGTLSREVAAAVSAQVAIALTRALAIETFTRIEAAREGERLRTALIDSLTHELRTPLTAIRAAATTLVQHQKLDEAVQRDMAALIDEESARLDGLIGQAIEMAEIEAKVVKVHPVCGQTRVLLEHAVEASHTALAAHTVRIEVDGPDTPVWFDPHLLARVLRHLLENAARYSPRASKIVLRSWRAHGRLEFSVEDNGPGIDSSDLPLIFEKFYRGKRGAAVGKGTGMGLPIARAILDAHGGGIDVASTPGQGTTFSFWVPLVEKMAESGKPD